MSKPTDPRRRLGIYKSIDEVPDRRRLQSYAAEFEGQDTWGAWMDTRDLADSTRKRIDRAERSWKDHMDERGRHHALARPDDVEAWCQALLDRMTVGTLYNRYYGHLASFYEWLVWHWDHPHQYNPVLMAVLQDGAARDAYREKLNLGIPHERA